MLKNGSYKMLQVFSKAHLKISKPEYWRDSSFYVHCRCDTLNKYLKFMFSARERKSQHNRIYRCYTVILLCVCELADF